MGPVKKKGMNKNRNMEINRPFYIVSDLVFNRVATVYSSKNIVIQTRTDKKEQ